MTVALTSIKISTDFDSGNIQVLDASDAYQLLLAINPDTRSDHYQWFHFKAQPFQGLFVLAALIIRSVETCAFTAVP
ncbi:hypothetical protein C1X23_23505, partial [Pseudomonas sp. FW300-E2]